MDYKYKYENLLERFKNQELLLKNVTLQLEQERVNKLNIPFVSKHRDLLIAYELENWEGSEATTEMVEQRVDEYLSNL